MGYELALESAGAIVHTSKHFGSYQGEWYAKVTYKNITGWVNGFYGSCSLCDGFESEFGYNSHYCNDGDCSKNVYSTLNPDCPQCQDLQKRLSDFGKSYLDNILTQEQAEKQAATNQEWDLEADDMVKYIVENR